MILWVSIWEGLSWSTFTYSLSSSYSQISDSKIFNKAGPESGSFTWLLIVAGSLLLVVGWELIRAPSGMPTFALYSQCQGKRTSYLVADFPQTEGKEEGQQSLVCFKNRSILSINHTLFSSVYLWNMPTSSQISKSCSLGHEAQASGQGSCHLSQVQM